MATVGIAGFGYGIRYQHGLFRQLFSDGWQVEQPEDWLAFGNPWEFERPEVTYEIGFGGTVESAPGRPARQVWRPAERVRAIAYDTPIVGWEGRWVNTLRLWSAGRGEPAALRPVQQRRLHGRGRRPGPLGEHRADPLSERRHAGRPGAAA